MDVNQMIMGIDLGTTNSAVCVHTRGLIPDLCPLDSKGSVTMPSCVMWMGGDDFKVGVEPYNERYKPSVKYSVKSMMGGGTPIKLVAEVTGEERLFRPEEISAQVLLALARRVWEVYGDIRKCIITVPAYFSQQQIRATLKAAEIAGLNCVQILKEPTSAAYTYSVLGYAKAGNVMVYDLGGGTFDVTVLSFYRKSDVPESVLTELERMYGIDVWDEYRDTDSLYWSKVIGTYGDTHLGGDDVDEEFVLNVLADYGKTKADLSVSDFEKLKLSAEKFKKASYSGESIKVGGEEYLLKAEHLSKAFKKVFDKTLAIIDGIPQAELDSVKTIVLVGGSTKSEYIYSLLKERFYGIDVTRVLDPDKTVAIGAGIVAGEAQVGKVSYFKDVLPMPIGVLKDGKTVEYLIPKNASMPYAVTKQFHTAVDDQTEVRIHIYQGLSKHAEKCTHLGVIHVDGLTPMPAGSINVGVSLLLSAQGRLSITVNVDGVEEPAELIVDDIFDAKESADKVDEVWMEVSKFASLCHFEEPEWLKGTDYYDWSQPLEPEELDDASGDKLYSYLYQAYETCHQPILAYLFRCGQLGMVDAKTYVDNPNQETAERLLAKIYNSGVKEMSLD